MREMISRLLTNYLTGEVYCSEPVSGLGFSWQETIQAGDVLLVEGKTRLSVAVRYLTQSTWSHAALVLDVKDGELIEADVAKGVIISSIEKYANFNVRICRPIGLSESQLRSMLQFAREHIGITYDMKNVFDLMRYLLPTPPVPTDLRRQLLTLGSGDPTEKLICSTLIARAFQSIGYPILPIQWFDEQGRVVSQKRDYSVFVPRDFDLSPYFAVIKPTVVHGFDYTAMIWSEQN